MRKPTKYICDGCKEEFDHHEPHLCVEGRRDDTYGEEHYCYSCSSDIKEVLDEMYSDDDRTLLEWALTVMRGETEEQNDP